MHACSIATLGFLNSTTPTHPGQIALRLSQFSSMIMMFAKAAFAFVCLLIHCSSAADYEYHPPACNMLVDKDREPLDALNLSVTCFNGSIASLAWSNTDKYNLETVHIEYQCYNSTSGEEITDTITIESYSQRQDYDKIVDVEELNDEDVYCTFRGCVELNRFGSPHVWITQAANCSSEDDVAVESHLDNVLVSSSAVTPYLSSVHFSSTSAPMLSTTTNQHSLPKGTPFSSNIANSGTVTTQSQTQQLLSTTTATAGKPTNIGGSTEVATGLIAALVTFFGGAGMIVLILILLSYRKWLRKTNFVQYDYEIKQEFTTDHIRSVSVYNMDNISTTGSNITVLHSLSIKHSPDFPSDNSQTDGESIDIKKAVKMEYEEKQQRNPQTEEDMDATSDCSTIAVESPVTKTIPANQHFDGYLATNSPTHSKPCIAAVKQGQPALTPGYTPNSCDDYISDDLSKNEHQTNIHTHTTPRTSPDPGCYDDTAESAYMSSTSTSSGTNNGYLMTTFSETSEYTKRQEDFCDESTPKTNPPLLLSNRHHFHDNSQQSEYPSNSNDNFSSYIQADSEDTSLPPLNRSSQQCDSSYVATDLLQQQNLSSSSDDVFIDLCETMDHHSPSKCSYLPNSYVPNGSETVANNSNYHSSDTAIDRSDYVMNTSNCVIPNGSIQSSSYAYNNGITSDEDTAGLDLCVVEDCNNSQVTSDGYMDQHNPMTYPQTITVDHSMIRASIPLWDGALSNPPLSEMQAPCMDNGYLPCSDVVEPSDVTTGLVSKQEGNPLPSNTENNRISNGMDSPSHPLTHTVIQDGYI